MSVAGKTDTHIAYVDRSRAKRDGVVYIDIYERIVDEHGFTAKLGNKVISYETASKGAAASARKELYKLTQGE